MTVRSMLVRRPVVLVMSAAVLVTGAWYVIGRRPVGDPAGTKVVRESAPARRTDTAPSPFRNVKPGMKPVGDAACAGCHAEIADAYHRHPMARDLTRPKGPLPGERYTADAGNPFEKFKCRFQVEHPGGRTVHHVATPSGQGRADEVAFAVGSGARGRSYVIERDGYLLQSPISWYTETGVWDLSPGFSRTDFGGLPVEPDCLFCHTNGADPVEGTVNRYRNPRAVAAVGCERCHGPGELHVEHHTSGGAATRPDYTIVNPKHLEPSLREAVCQQCHFTSSYRIPRWDRAPFDYRPGLPLQDYWTLFSSPPELDDNHRHGNRVEQMSVSRCFRASAGAMGCTSCHDPHAVPDPGATVAFYRDRCLRCHADRGCGLAPDVRRQRVPSDSCATCHMPRQGSKKAAHVSETDHRILRRPDPSSPPPRPVTIGPRQDLLLPFHLGLPGPSADEVLQDLGEALVKVVEYHPALREHAARQAISILNRAVTTRPDSVPARRARAKLMRLLGRPGLAMEDYRVAEAVAPGSESLLAEAGEAAGDLKAWSAAEGYWARAAAINPQSATYRERLAEVLSHLGRSAEAGRAAREALRLDPTRIYARTALVSALLSAGDRAGAKADFDILMALDPPNPEELRRWYAEQTR